MHQRSRGATTRTSEIDLVVYNAATGQAYTEHKNGSSSGNPDHDAWIPRGTRLVVERTFAPRGLGFWSRVVVGSHHKRLQRNANVTPTTTTTDDETFVIDGRLDDEDEYVHTSSASSSFGENDDDDKNHNNSRNSPPSVLLDSSSKRPVACLLETQQPHHPAASKRRRRGMPKTIEQQLRQMKAASSEDARSNEKLMPDYLQCPLCRNVIRDAVVLGWDRQGRSTCETCIRQALLLQQQHAMSSQQLECPLTGRRGVSVTQLVPNTALRRLARQYHSHKDAVAVTVVSKVPSLETSLAADTSRSSCSEARLRGEEEAAAAKDEFGGDVFAF